MSRWIRIVGEVAPTARLAEPEARGTFLDGEVPELTVYPATERMRDLLMYERGVGPESPDGRPEPTGPRGPWYG